MRKLIFLLIIFAGQGAAFAAGVPGDLSAVYAYPTPYRPSAGNTFISFTNLPQYTLFEIYNTAGVREKSFYSNPLNSVISWDFLDSTGQVLPDDVYYAVITDTPTQSSATRYLLKEIGGAGQTLTRTIPNMTPKTETVRNYDVNGLYVGDTTLVIRGTESGSVSAMGGVKGFVNPMNGEKLTIGYKATGPGTIKTKIFDGKGRLVREFSDLTDGTQVGSLQWDARDSGGKLVASGVYLIHVEGPGINTTKRTVILK